MKREREREAKKLQPTEKERKLGIVSMMIFDSATSSFPPLLVIKSFAKKLKCEIRKVSRFCSGKNVKSHFLSRAINIIATNFV